MAQDKSVGPYPGYRIVKAKGKVPYTKTLKNGKRGAVIEIEEFNDKKNKYKMKYEGRVEDLINSKELREGNPVKLSRIEREFLVKQSSMRKPIPNHIEKWF